MTWRTEQASLTSIVICDGDRVVGSIKVGAKRDVIEIMWGGPGGDITASFTQRSETLAFIKGVEEAFKRIAPPFPEPAVTL